MKRTLYSIIGLLAVFSVGASAGQLAQRAGGQPVAGVVGTGTVVSALLVDADGTLHVTGSFSGTSSVQGTGTAGTPAGGVLTVQGATSMTPLLITPSLSSAGGCTPATPVEVAASDNHQTVVTGAHMLCQWSAFNSGSADQFIRIYDAASGFNGCNSASNLKYEGQIPANSSSTGAGFVEAFPNGLAFASGISICVTGAFGSTDTTNATASKSSVNLSYK